MLKEVTINNFETEVKNAENPVLVYFWAPWCGPCKTMKPILEEAAEILDGKADIAKINVETEPGLASMHMVMTMPSMLLFVGGEVKASASGVRQKDEVVKLVEENV